MIIQLFFDNTVWFDSFNTLCHRKHWLDSIEIKNMLPKGNRQWYINLNYYECRSKRAKENIKQKKNRQVLCYVSRSGTIWSHKYVIGNKNHLYQSHHHFSIVIQCANKWLRQEEFLVDIMGFGICQDLVFFIQPWGCFGWFKRMDFHVTFCSFFNSEPRDWWRMYVFKAKTS